MPWRHKLVHYSRPLLKVALKLAVPIFAIRGNYPSMLLTPDDPVSPFGCGTTPGASREESMVKIYERFGRYIGDCIWLGWRNSGYGVAYYLKPGWLKNPRLKYEDLFMDVEHPKPGVVTFWLCQPDGRWLWETQRKIGPFTLITGYRIEPIWNGHCENLLRLGHGQPRAPRPAFHPNMDGRPLVSLRTARTLA